MELEKYARDFIFKTFDNLIEYQIDDTKFWYYFDTEIWEIPRSLQRGIEEKCGNVNNEVGWF